MFFNTIALQITLITEQFQNSGHIALGYAIAKCTKNVITKNVITKIVQISQRHYSCQRLPAPEVSAFFTKATGCASGHSLLEYLYLLRITL